MSDDVYEDALRSAAVKMVERNGWIAGDTMGLNSVLCLMVDFAKQAQSISDRCGFPDCGCDYDARCMSSFEDHQHH